jgi:opacity protein-like surface antigen
VRKRLCALLLVLGAADARAAAKEWEITVAPSYAVAYADQRTAHGGGANLKLGLGVSDTVTLHVRGLLAWHGADAIPAGDGVQMRQAGALGGFGAFFGFSYTLDVIRLQPVFDVEVGALGLRGRADFGGGPEGDAVMPPITGFAVGLGFGLDWLVTRHVAIGAEVRYHAFLTDLERLPMYLTTGLRAVFRFGRAK